MGECPDAGRKASSFVTDAVEALTRKGQALGAAEGLTRPCVSKLSNQESLREGRSPPEQQEEKPTKLAGDVEAKSHTPDRQKWSQVLDTGVWDLPQSVKQNTKPSSCFTHGEPNPKSLCGWWERLPTETASESFRQVHRGDVLSTLRASSKEVRGSHPQNGALRSHQGRGQLDMPWSGGS